ncbi:MAG: DUF4270 domain-containing protein [Bacteroidales bacterium]|jgi:hypothetical protein|nr:DUF4270 domain-containing protein [Bacteroidales bacterium]
MLKNIKYILLLLLSFIFISCVSEDEDLGLNLVNQDEMTIKTFDYLAMRSAFFHEDSLKMVSNSDVYSLGECTDAEFGKVSSTIFTQISMPSAKDFTVINIDSIVMGLYFSGSFTKDSNLKIVNMHVEIKELDTDFSDSIFYSSSEYRVSSAPALFDKNILFNPDTVMIFGDTNDTATLDTITKQLRLKLSDNFKNNLNLQSFEENAAFQQWLKGIRIKASPVNANEGMIAQFNLTVEHSGIFVYYKDNEGKSQIYRFVIDKDCKRFAHIDYTSGSIPLLTIDTLHSENYGEKIYIGGLGVAMGKISIDSLIQWYHLDTINLSAINQAVLVLPLASGSSTNGIPARLYCSFDTISVSNNDTTTVYRYVDDLYYYGDYFSGHYDPATNSYRMRITQHLFKCMKGERKNHNLFINVPNRLYSPNQVILSKPKIEIILTQ